MCHTLKPSIGKVLHAWPASPDLFYRQAVETEVRSPYGVEHHNTTWYNSSERDSVNEQRWPTMAHLISKDGTGQDCHTVRALPLALALPISMSEKPLLVSCTVDRYLLPLAKAIVPA